MLSQNFKDCVEEFEAAEMNDEVKQMKKKKKQIISELNQQIEEVMDKETDMKPAKDVELDLHDMTCADLDQEDFNELRGLAAENMVEIKKQIFPDTEVIITSSHHVGVENAEELTHQQDMAMGELSLYTSFFHVRPSDVARTFTSAQQFKERQEMKVQGPSIDAETGEVQGGVIASDEAIDALKEPLDRFQDCPDCGYECVIPKSELADKPENTDFKCEQCGNQFTLAEVKEE